MFRIGGGRGKLPSLVGFGEQWNMGGCKPEPSKIPPENTTVPVFVQVLLAQ